MSSFGRSSVKPEASAPGRSSSPTPSHSSRARRPTAPPEDSYDAFVRAANPAHPDHAQWLERFGNRSGDASTSRRGSTAQLPSAANSVRRMQTLQKAESLKSVPRDQAAAGTNGRANGSEMRDGGEAESAGDSASRARRKKKRRDKGKRRALPPPIPPPRTTSAFHGAAAPPGVAPATEPSPSSKAENSRGNGIPNGHTADASRNGGHETREQSHLGASGPSLMTSIEGQRQPFERTDAARSVRRLSPRKGQSALPEALAGPSKSLTAPLPAPPAPVAERADLSNALPKEGGAGVSDYNGDVRDGRSDVEHPYTGRASLQSPDVRDLPPRSGSRASSFRDGRSTPSALRRGLGNVIASLRGAGKKEREAASAVRRAQEEEALDRMASPTPDRGESSAVDPQEASSILQPAFVYTPPGQIESSAIPARASLDSTRSLHSAPVLPYSSGNTLQALGLSSPPPVRTYRSGRTFVDRRPLSNIRDARESGTEAENDGFFDARSDDPGDADASPTSEKDSLRVSRRRSLPATSVDLSAGPDALATNGPASFSTISEASTSKDRKPARPQRARKSLDTSTVARAHRKQAVANEGGTPKMPSTGISDTLRSPLQAEMAISGDDSSADDLPYANVTHTKSPASLRRKRSASSHKSQTHLQRERESVAQAQATRRSSRASIASASWLASPDAAESVPPLPARSAELIAASSPPAAPLPIKTRLADLEDAAQKDMPDELRRQRQACANEYFIPPVYTRPSSSGRSTNHEAGRSAGSGTGQRLPSATSSRSLASSFRRGGMVFGSDAGHNYPTSIDHGDPGIVDASETSKTEVTSGEASVSPPLLAKVSSRSFSGLLGRMRGPKSASRTGTPTTLSAPGDMADSTFKTNSAGLSHDPRSPLESPPAKSREPVGLGIESQTSTERRQRSEGTGWRARVASIASTKSNHKGMPAPASSPVAALPTRPSISTEAAADEAGWRRNVLSQAVGLSLSPRIAQDHEQAASLERERNGRPSFSFGRSSTEPSRTPRLNGKSSARLAKATARDEPAASATIHKSLSPALLNDTGRHEADDISSNLHASEDDAFEMSATSADPSITKAIGPALAQHLGAQNVGSGEFDASDIPPSPIEVRLVRPSMDLLGVDEAAPDPARPPLGTREADNQHDNSSSPRSLLERRKSRSNMISTHRPSPPPLQLKSPAREHLMEGQSLTSSPGSGTAARGVSLPNTSPDQNPSKSPKLLAQFRRAASQGVGSVVGLGTSKTLPNTPNHRGISSDHFFLENNGAVESVAWDSLAAVEDATRMLAVSADQMIPTPTTIGTPGLASSPHRDYPFVNQTGKDTRPGGANEGWSPSSANPWTYDSATSMDVRAASLTHDQIARRPSTSDGARARAASTKSSKSARPAVASPELDAFGEMLRASARADAARIKDIAARSAAQASSAR
ncbi:hypothetical protein IE81DRAFT_91296 [Ceraceosorus guamensis]|uniref:Uncharacterized protein n=1 Tax=Ceraceosorus guamensis TaxID=1522189 RepID=A0A316W1P2_9BASI|nr:hypothetical protein IE81DRAFT_91296 [Ceraceosorus guamensis]PWN43444.1 hypothetical protein IE81DRAFT_91296 [Ceraceosorus guamensis]